MAEDDAVALLDEIEELVLTTWPNGPKQRVKGPKLANKPYGGVWT